MKPSLIIIGLGNHGKTYQKTRHNIGFQALDVLSKEFGEGEWKESDKFVAEIQEGRIVTFPILLVKPRTYMNLSGDAVRKLVEFYKLDPKHQILVISDDIDLPLGDVRFREKGGPGTHNGLKSIVEIYGEDFPRIRIGLGQKPEGFDLAAWVLSVPSAEEQKAFDGSFAQISAIVRKYLLGG